MLFIDWLLLGRNLFLLYITLLKVLPYTLRQIKAKTRLFAARPEALFMFMLRSCICACTSNIKCVLSNVKHVNKIIIKTKYCFVKTICFRDCRSSVCVVMRPFIVSGLWMSQMDAVDWSSCFNLLIHLWFRHINVNISAFLGAKAHFIRCKTNHGN